MGRYRAGYQDELVPGEQCVPESLLAGTGYPRPQPVGIGDGFRFHHVNAGRLSYGRRRQHMRHRVQRLEAFMDRDLKDGSRNAEQWLERPAIGLHQRRSIDLLATPAGMEMIEAFLTRLEYGVYK
jgi:putative toxin-antitoxin system antitoxin component (TIGR02293 family)